MTQALEYLRSLHFYGLILKKVYNVSARKVQRSYLWLHSRLIQVWKKIGLCFQKLRWGIWQIFTRAIESVQIVTLMASFCLKLKCMSFKFTGELCVTAMKNDVKFEEELNCQFKIGGIWQTLARALKNLKKVHFNRLLLTKVNNIWAKKK